MAKRKEAASSTLSSYLYVVRGFLAFNGVSLRWKRIEQTLPPLRRHGNDRAPTQKEIRRLLSKADHRLRAAALMMASGGLRVGAFWYPKVKGGHGFMRVRDVSFRESGTAAVRVYAGEPEEYTAFVSGEAVAALKSYWRLRRRRGEWIGPYSPVLTVHRGHRLPRTVAACRRRYERMPSEIAAPLTSDGIQSAFEDAWKSSGVLPRDGPPEFKLCHGLRKRWQTEAKRCVGMRIGTWRGVDDRIAREDVEVLLGHRSSYHRPTFERLEAVYLSLQPLLLVNSSRSPTMDQPSACGDFDMPPRELRREIARQSREIAALSRRLDVLLSMVGRLIPDGGQTKQPTRDLEQPLVVP